MDPIAPSPPRKFGMGALSAAAATAATAGLLANLELHFDFSNTIVVTGNPITLTVPACQLPPLRP